MHSLPNTRRPTLHAAWLGRSLALHTLNLPLARPSTAMLRRHTDMAANVLRMGILGAAHIAPMALIRPAREVPEVEVTAIAARDPGRARAFANKHGIARVHPTYDALLADPEIDAVYNPLPNGLHCEWSIKALQAGKHVLCEKPLAANADEAARMVATADATGRALVEAFHWRYHPLAARMRAVIDSGVLGAIRRIETHFCIPLPFRNDIRYRYDLGGGATMDVGCYTISVLRFLAGAEPEVVHAEAKLASPEVDRRMDAELRFPDGRTGHITCALFSAALFRARAKVLGDGEMKVFNPYAPHFFNRLRVQTPERTTVERVPGDATYTYQLRAFAERVRSNIPLPTEGEDAIANMRVIDAVYEKAGLKRRGT